MHSRRAIIAAAFLSLMLGIRGQCLAQSRHNDVSLGYGVVTIDQASDILHDVILVTLTLGTYSKTDQKFSGAPFLTYHFSSNSRLGFGFALGGYRTTGKIGTASEVSGTFTETNYIGALEIDYHWVMRKHFQLYSGLGVGARLKRGAYNDTSSNDSETTTKVLPTFHLNAIGFRVGGAIGFFGELGMGYKGLVAFGLNAQF